MDFKRKSVVWHCSPMFCIAFNKSFSSRNSCSERGMGERERDRPLTRSHALARAGDRERERCFPRDAGHNSSKMHP